MHHDSVLCETVTTNSVNGQQGLAEALSRAKGLEPPVKGNACFIQ